MWMKKSGALSVVAAPEEKRPLFLGNCRLPAAPGQRYAIQCHLSDDWD
jgi:hypothetical protein